MSIRSISYVTLATLALSVMATSGWAQPQLSPQGGGTGNAEMPHSQMGGPQQGRPSSGSAPALRPQGGGTGNADMPHGQMGGANMGGGTPSMQNQGGGTGNAQMAHPDSPGTGQGQTQGGRPAR